MRPGLVAWLERRWYGGTPPEWPLRALAALYGSISKLRRRVQQHRLGDQRLPVPVIVVGNLSVGGTGKTPLTIALIDALQARAWRPGVISRGYGGSAVAAERVSAQSRANRVGDEPLLIHRRSGAPVAVARRRIDAARLLIDSRAVDVLIADDGLQHYALPRDVEVLVCDGRRRHGNGLLLPAGPLRELPERAQRCDYHVVNGGTPQPGEFAMRVQMRDAVSLQEPTTSVPLAEFAGRRVHAVAGIGDPSRFFDALRAVGIEPLEHPFPDHHSFERADLLFGEPLPLLMTEKDAVKCAAFAPPDSWQVPVAAGLPEEFFDSIHARLRQLLGTAR